MVRALINKLKSGETGELIKGSASGMLFRVLGIGLSYLFTLYLTRNYGVVTTGYFALTQMVLMIAVTVSRFGLDISFLKLASPESPGSSKLKGDYLNTLGLITVLGFIATLVVWFGSEVIAVRWFHMDALEPYIKITAIAILPMAWYRLNGEALRSAKKIGQYVALDRIYPFLITLCILIPWPEDESSPYYFFWAYVAAVIMTSAIGFISWWKSSSIGSAKTGNGLSHYQLLVQGFPMFMSGAMFVVMGWTDSFMLGIFTGEEEVGLYHVALKLANGTAVALFAVNSISASQIAVAYRKGTRIDLQRVVSKASNLILLLTLPVVLSLWIFPSFWLNLFGPEFIQAKMALTILAGGQLMNATCGPVMYLLQMTDNQKIGQNIMIVAAMLNLVLNYLLIPEYGISGAAASTSIGIVFWNVASVIAVRRRLKIWSLPLIS